MTMPVTSTRVATKGAEDTAGSMPSRLRINGSMEPLRVPQSTTPMSEIHTVAATSGQWGP